MTWVTWRQYRFQSALAVALLAALGVVLLISGLHGAWVWHSALAGCAKDNSCGNLGNLSLSNPAFTTLVVATSAVPLLPGLFWGAPMVASELEAGTNQFAWTQGITKRRWLTVKAGWLLLGAAILAGAVSAIVTWWSGPYNAYRADGFDANRFDVTDIVPVSYALFAMALGICAGLLLRRTIPAMAVTLAGFAAVRVLTAQLLRPHYMTPITMYYNLAGNWSPPGAVLGVSQGIVGPNGQAASAVGSGPSFNGISIPAECQQPSNIPACLAAHGYRGVTSYQPASRFWAFQGIETGIFVALAVILLGVAFWVLKRRDA
jgi:ABC-type transport system involved in multi-copper enzyme maturation permease subunit